MYNIDTNGLYEQTFNNEVCNKFQSIRDFGYFPFRKLKG